MNLDRSLVHQKIQFVWQSFKYATEVMELLQALILDVAVAMLALAEIHYATAAIINL